MQRKTRLYAGLIVCLACSFATLGAQAQTKPGPLGSGAEYDHLIDHALAAFEARDFSRARTLFEQAHALQPSARTLRGLGVTAVELRNYETAEDELEAALADHRKPLTANQRLEVSELLEWMRSSLGTLHLTLLPPSSIARIDERRTAGRTLRLDPGEHTLEVRAEGYRSHEQRFSLDRGQELALRVDLVPEPVANSRQRIPQPDPATSLAPGHDARDESTSLIDHWWFWATVGVVAAVGAVTVVALTRDPGQRPFETGGVHGVLETLRFQR